MQAATPLTPESIAMHTWLRLPEAYQYHRILRCIASVGNLSEAQVEEVHTILMDTASIYGLTAPTNINGTIVRVASPIAMARLALETVRREQNLMLGGEGA